MWLLNQDLAFSVIKFIKASVLWLKKLETPVWVKVRYWLNYQLPSRCKFPTVWLQDGIHVKLIASPADWTLWVIFALKHASGSLKLKQNIAWTIKESSRIIHLIPNLQTDMDPKHSIINSWENKVLNITKRFQSWIQVAVCTLFGATFLTLWNIGSCMQAFKADSASWKWKKNRLFRKWRQKLVENYPALIVTLTKYSSLIW